MDDNRSPPTEADGGWKQIVDDLFPEFLRFYFPQVYRAIDFSQTVEFLEQELHKLFPASKSSRRIVDKLVQVTWKGRGPTLLLIHIEIQGQPDPKFPKRMFTYYYRLFDRYDKPVTSLALLVDADPAFRPSRLAQETPGTRLVFDYSLVKLLDHKTERELREDSSPFALASLIQWKKLQVGSHAGRLLATKVEMARALFRRGYASQQVRSLFRFLDYIMKLPPELERQFEQTLVQEAQTTMTYLSSIERRALERGFKKGIEKGIEKGGAEMLLWQIGRKFGEVTEEIRRRVYGGNSEQIRQWGERILTAKTVDEIFE